MTKIKIIAIGMIVGLALSSAFARADTYDVDFSGLTMTVNSDGSGGNLITVAGKSGDGFALQNTTLGTSVSGSPITDFILSIDLDGTTVKALNLSTDFGAYSLSENFAGVGPAPITINDLADFESVSGASVTLPGLSFNSPVVASGSYLTLDTSSGNTQVDVNFVTVAPTPMAGFGAAAIFMVLGVLYVVRRFNRSARLI